MKKLFVFLIVILMSSFAIAENTLTVEDLEDSMGFDIDTSDSYTLKLIIDAWDTELTKEMRVYDELIQKCLARLIDLGETKWVNEYTQLDKTDLLKMSYAELVELKDKINLAMWQSYIWEEVTVPQGTWKVGQDIPAGHWTVKCHPDTWATNISWGDHLSDNGESISYWGRYSISNTVYNPDNETFDPINDISTYSFEVQDGDYIKIIYGAAIFMPYIGTEITFGFK